MSLFLVFVFVPLNISMSIGLLMMGFFFLLIVFVLFLLIVFVLLQMMGIRITGTSAFLTLEVGLFSMFVRVLYLLMMGSFLLLIVFVLLLMMGSFLLLIVFVLLQMMGEFLNLAFILFLVSIFVRLLMVGKSVMTMVSWVRTSEVNLDGIGDAEE